MWEVLINSFSPKKLFKGKLDKNTRNFLKENDNFENIFYIFYIIFSAFQPIWNIIQNIFILDWFAENHIQFIFMRKRHLLLILCTLYCSVVETEYIKYIYLKLYK